MRAGAGLLVEGDARVDTREKVVRTAADVCDELRPEIGSLLGGGDRRSLVGAADKAATGSVGYGVGG